MEFDFNSFSNTPLVIDLLHCLLLGVVVVFAILWLTARAQLKAALQTADSQPVDAAPRTEQPAEPIKLQTTGPESALQLLSLLQHEGRFVDFLHEDLAGFSDAEIGAVARVVHEGSKKTLSTYFTIAPLRSEDEESQVSVEEGFDPASVRLTGNVVGQAPFTGTLIHRGWEVRSVNLPRLAEGHNTAIIAPAEVEL